MTDAARPLRRALPFLRWWPRVNRASTRADLMAGFTGALLGLPQGVAFALLAGLPPEYGLYCAIGPAIVAALFGSSWHLVSGPTAAISIVVFLPIVTVYTTWAYAKMRGTITLETIRTDY